SLDFDSGSAAEGLQAAVHVVERGCARTVLGISRCRFGEAGDAAVDSLLFVGGGRLSWWTYGTCRGHSRARNGSGSSWRFRWRGGGHRKVGHGLAVGVDRVERWRRRAVRQQQLVQVQHCTNIGLSARATDGPQPVDTGRDLSATRIRRRGLGFVVDSGHDLVVAHPHDVASFQHVAERKRLGQRALVIVDKGSVGAEVFEIIVYVAESRARGERTRIAADPGAPNRYPPSGRWFRRP